MLDELSVENLVRQQIALEVNRKIEEVVADRQWLDEIEERIVKHVQDRITARFSNIATVPDLIDAVKDSVKSIINQGHIPGISQYVDPVKITQTVDHGIETFVSSVIQNLSLDHHWLEKIQTRIDQQMSQQVLEKLSGVDLNAVLAVEADRSMCRWQQKILESFASHGIEDLASTPKLFIADNSVDFNAPIMTTDITVQGTLTTNALVVKGVINTDNASWNELVEKIANEVFEQTSEQWRQELVAQTLAIACDNNIDFGSVSIKGQPLIHEGALNEHVRRSSLNRVGNLENLVVDGHVRLNDTVNVSRGRIGINTDTPDMALSVWDEEITISLGKLSKQQAYIGTSRLSNLTIGVNRKAAIEIDTDLLTTVQGLRIQRHRISFAPEVPGTSGTRGDIVFNSDPKPNAPFAWVCLGNFKWQPVKSAL